MAITAYIGFGSNLGDLLDNFKKAQAKLAQHPDIEILRSSRLYRSEPLTPDGQDLPWYLNGVVEISTTLSLHRLLELLKKIEKSLGRKTRKRWASRVIDLDILFYGNVVYQDREIQIPHGEMIYRKFVLKPLCDLIPDFRHPDLDLPLSELLAHTPDKLQCEALPSPSFNPADRHAV